MEDGKNLFIQIMEQENPNEQQRQTERERQKQIEILKKARVENIKLKKKQELNKELTFIEKVTLVATQLILNVNEKNQK